MPGFVPLDRRRFLRLAGLTGAAAGLDGALAGCRPAAVRAGRRQVRIGWVSSRSGRWAGYGQADDHVLQQARRTVLADGLALGGRSYQVRLLVRDSRSDPSLARAAARELIDREQVDMVLASSMVETTVPVADECEAAGIPCVTTGTPYQTWFLARRGVDPGMAPRPFRWTWHMFWGLEDVIAVFADMWGQLVSDQVVGVLWPDDLEGRAWGDAETGFPAFLRPQGYRLVDPGAYRAGSERWTGRVDAFRAARAEIVAGVPAPVEFAAFWRRARQRGYRPRIASLARALTFPVFLEAMGDAEGLSAEVSWSPAHPWRSSLDGRSSAQLADGYTAATGRQWVQPLGLAHALLEVAVDALRRAGGPEDKLALAAAVRGTDIDTVAGHVAWVAGQADLPNVARTPLVGGQWRGGRRWPLELVVVSNEAHPEIPAGGTLEPLS
jgi:branched-chain amino acid transport system substrate-binding protein